MRISKQKRDKIAEQILALLYSKFPSLIYTSAISAEIARDEEFIKSMLLELEKKELVIKINKSPEGIIYSRRLRWRLSNKAHEAYSKNQ